MSSASDSPKKDRKVSFASSPLVEKADKVGYIPAEFKFAVTLVQDERGHVLDAVVDTGCGGGYLVGNSLDLVAVPVCFPVSMADGQTTIVREMVEVELVLGNRVEKVGLRVLPNTEVQPYVLFGRELMTLFQVGVTEGGEILVDGSRMKDTVGFLRDVVGEIEDLMLDIPIPQQQDRATLYVDSRVQLNAELSLEKKVGQSEELKFCVGAKMMLRSIREDEELDTPEQRFVYELHLPPLAEGPKPHNRFYSESVVRRLDAVDKAEFDSLVDAYVQAGWWKVSDLATCKRECQLVANVFPVKAPGKKMRLVSDFRGLNTFYPSSARMTKIYHPPLLLRLLKADGLIIGDCKSAFYRVRLARPVWLNVGGIHILCYRMAFGLSMGPEGLHTSLGDVWNTWRSNLAVGPGHGGLFVDDFFLTQPKDAGSLLYLMGLCGFEVSKEKFQYLLESSKLLGVTIDKQMDKVSVSCCTEKRIEEIKQFIGIIRKGPTKKLVFGLAGIIGYDVTHTHPEWRVIADLLRSVTGRYKIEWNQKLVMEEQHEVVFWSLIDWIDELLSNHQCVQITDVSGGELHLRIQTDASKFGYGIVIGFKSRKEEDWTTVFADAGIFNKTQRNYHVNRLEAWTMLIGMRIVCMLKKYINDSLLGNTVIPSFVEIISDSTTAVAWARTGEAQAGLSYKSVEMRSVTVLAEALHEELTIMRKQSDSVSISHMEGELNVEADRLSRLLYRPVGQTTIGELMGPQKKPKVLKLQEPREPPLVELLAQDSYDLPQLLWKLACLNASLGGRLHHGNQTPVDFFSFDAFSPTVLNLFGRIVQSTVSRQGWTKPYIEIDEVWYFERVRFTGDVLRQLVIPGAELPRTKELIAKYYHRKNLHRGRRYDVSVLCESPFYIEGVTTVVQRMIQKCILCAKKNAAIRRGNTMPVGVVPRDLTLQPFSRVSIDFVHCRKATILSAVCTDTGVLYLTVVDAASSQGAVQGLQSLANTYCVVIQRIHSDNAQALSKAFQAACRKEWGPSLQFSYRVPYRSEQNPVERSHREMWSLLKARRFARALDEDEVEVSNSTLFKISAILNKRPIGVNEEGVIITPALLAWGASWSGGQTKLVAVREYFYSNLFALQRRRHLHTRHSRRYSTFIGQRVLFQYDGGEGKDSFQHEVGTVVQLGTSLVTVRAGGKNFQVASKSVIPLDDYYQPLSAGGHVVDKGADVAPTEIH